MSNQGRSPSLLLVEILALALASGCASDRSHSGRQIIDDLERAGVPAPARDGAEPAPTSPAALPPDGPITLADLLRVAEQRNPALAAARSDVGIAAGERWQASMYPNPRADVLAEDISLRDGPADAKTTVGITQPIILGNRRGAAMNAAAARQAARLAEVEAKRRALFGDIAAEHARLVSLGEQQALYQELRGLAGSTLSAASARFEAKAAPETDVIRPRVEVHRIEAALTRLTQERAASARRLGLLLGGVKIDASRIQGEPLAVPPALDLDQLSATVRSSHPSLAVADREIEAAEARLEQIRAELTPDLDLRVAAGYRGEQDDAIIELGAGMWLPLWDRREGDLMSARFALMRTRQDRVTTENDLLTHLTTAVGDYEAARSQFLAFRDQIVPDAQRAFDQTGEGYRGGRSSFLDLLDAQRTLTEARATLAELSGSVAATRAAVLQIIGPDGLAAAPAADSHSDRSPTPDQRPSDAEATP